MLALSVVVGCDPGPTETDCSNGIDDDANGFTDCNDLACRDVCADGGGPTDGGMMQDGGGGGGCDASNCDGCCDGDQCLSGASLAACGQGGIACETCAIGASCEATGCEGGPVACGPGNCDGCCMDDICVMGDRPAACGTGGGACTMCESWETCGDSGCGVDLASEWQVSLLDAVVPPTAFGGSDWDGIGGGEVDPYVQLRVGSAGATPLTLPTIESTLTPDWTEGGTTTTLSERVTAAQILAFLRFDMFDEDTAFDDVIGMCRYDMGETPFNGEIVTLVCEEDATSEHAGFTLRWQLVPG